MTREMHGFVVVGDATAPASFRAARGLIGLFTAAHAVPYGIAARRQDVAGAARLGRTLDVPPADVLIMPCVAFRKIGVRQVLRRCSH